MLKVRVVLVFLSGENVLLQNNSLPSFVLLKNDDLQKRLLSFVKGYFNYPDIWFDFRLIDPVVDGDELNLVYGVLVGKDNTKGEWKNVGRIKEKDIQEFVYNVSKMV